VTDDDIEARLAALSSSDRERLEALLAARRVDQRPAQESRPNPRGRRDAPLSWQQERIWYLEQLGFGGTFPLVHRVRLAGSLDVEALQRSLEHLVERHEALRTVVEVTGGGLRQVVIPTPSGLLRRLDSGESPSDGELLVRRAVTEMTSGALTTSSIPFRCVLVKVTAELHVLVLGVHHIAFDGWSASVLLAELSTAYAAFRVDEPPALPCLTYSYGDYAAWQRGRPILDADVEVWRRAMEGLDAPADLVPAISLGTTGPHPLAVRHVTVAGPLLARLRALARQRGMTLFMVLDAALSMVVSRWSGVADVVIGTPVAGRDLPGVAHLVGCFSTVVPLRVRVDPWASATDVLDEARRVCSIAFDHYDVPIEEVVSVAGGRRDSGRNPLYEILLAASSPIAPLLLPGLEVTLEVAERAVTDTVLTVGVCDNGDRLDLSLEYDAGLLDSETATRLSKHLHTLLGSLAEDPKQAVADLALVPPDEQRAILVAGDRTSEAPADSGLTLDGLFAEHAAAFPDDTALIDDNGRHSYRELAVRVSALAARLRAEGEVPPVIAVGVSHSVDYVVAVLAVLHSGAAYLAMDTTLPDDRLLHMLRDSGAGVAVVDDSGQRRFGALHGDLRLITFSSATDGAPDLTLRRAAAGSPAYLIYTSGSTGRPKAVVGTHTAMVNRLSWHWRTFPAGPGDVLCLKTSPAFVDAVTELFTGLLRGTPTAITPQHDAADPERLAAALERLGVTQVVMVPELLAAMLDLPDIGHRLRRIRVVTLSGSRLTPEVVDSVASRLPGRTLLNLYGSAEVAADVTWWACRGDEDRVPIGSAISGVRCRVVDETGALVPVGVPGELLIGGVALAQGYAFRPGLTARAFVPDPWGDGERLYRTGDRVRWREPGVLEFLGRMDAQVKIRGVRVEPGEVEAALEACPGIQSAAVVAHNGPTGDQRLAGFLVGTADPEQVRALLRGRLPAAMIPSTFNVVDGLPHTPSGKVDRSVLASWPATTGAGATSDVTRKPRTPIEHTIAAVWGTVVAVTDPGLDDDFFALGGNSLLITRLASRLSHTLAREVPIRLIHDNPVLGDLCLALSSTPAERAAPVPSSRLPNVPASSVTTVTDVRIDERILNGAVAPIDAAAVTYVPGHWLREGLVPPELWEREFVEPAALLAAVHETPAGRIGLLVAPIGADRLYGDPANTAELTAQAVERAGALGARAVSLTGLLPSATNYGAAVPTGSGTPITTGHEVTASAVAMTVLAALERLSRRVQDETLCVLGTGSIGLTSMRLLLDTEHHPRRIVLCDLFARRQVLEREAEVLAGLCDSETTVVTTAGPPPEEVYSAGVVIGAVNVEGILDVDRVRPGAIVVDDSFPRCFDVGDAVRRMATRSDALFLEAGLVAGPVPLHELRYLPGWLTPAVGDVTTRRFEREIMGCVLSSALLASTAGMTPTIGPVRPADAVAALDRLISSGFSAAQPQCDGHVVTNEVFARVSSRVPRS
jgi:amino acid adenylation domain-containing protein